MSDTDIELLTPAIDWQKCLALSNQNVEIARLALTAFVDDLRENLTKAQQSLQDKDIERFQTFIHKLHGGSYYCGVPELSKCLAELEKQSKTARLEDLPALMLPLQREADKIFSAYLEHSYESSSS